MLNTHIDSANSLQDVSCKPIVEARAFNTAGASHYIAHSDHYLKKARRGKTVVPGPRFLRIGRRVVYLREDLDKWLDQFLPGIDEKSRDPIHRTRDYLGQVR